MLAWLWTRLSEGGSRVSISGRALRRFPERQLDRLLRARVLIEQRKADSWSLCAHCDCGLDARPIREVGDELRACCPHDASEDVVLDEDDTRRFSIDADRLAGAIAASGEVSGPVARIVDGVWSIGSTPAGRSVMLCENVAALVASGTILSIKSTAGHRPITVIANEFDAAAALRLNEAGMDGLRIADCLIATEAGTERLVLDRAVPPSAAPRLVLGTRDQIAMLDGRRLDLPPQMFALFCLLAAQTRQRHPVLKKETIEAQTGRPANEIVRDLRRTLVACGLAPETARALVMTVRGYGYRLALQLPEVAIDD